MIKQSLIFRASPRGPAHRAHRPLSALILALALPLAGLAGCGGGEEVIQDPACNAVDADSLEVPFAPLVHPLQIHTGTNGREVYQAVAATNFGIVEWTSSDQNVATVETVGCVENNGFGVTGLVTARSAGSATLTARSGSFSQNVALTVVSYTIEQYELGDQRYNNPANPSAARQACADCHVGADAAPHTPLEMAIHDDAAIIEATKLSKYPDECVSDADGSLCSCTPEGTDPDLACAACPEPSCSFVDGNVLSLAGFGGGLGDHVWDLTPEEEVAVMAYMRSIPPDGISQ